MNIFQKLFCPVQKYHFSVPVSKEEFFAGLNKQDFIVTTEGDTFTFRKQRSLVSRLLVRNSLYYVGKGTITKSSETKTNLSVTFRMNAFGLGFIIVWTTIMLIMFHQEIISAFDCFTSGDEIYIFMALFGPLMYIIGNAVGQTLITKFISLITYLGGSESEEVEV